MNVEDDILIECFLKGELSKKEEQSFLERLASDVDFKERFILEKQLRESLNEDSWSFVESSQTDEIKDYEQEFKSKEIQELKEIIAKANEEYKESQKPTKNWFFYFAAAVAIVLFSTLIFDTKKQSNEDLFSSYLQETDLLSLVDRGRLDSMFSAAETYYNNKEFDKVVNTLTPLIDTTKNSNAFVYLAISHTQLKKYTEAENVLNKLIESDLLDSQKGYWYKSLVYLKSNQLKKLKKELQFIIENNYYQSKTAEKLLEDL